MQIVSSVAKHRNLRRMPLRALAPCGNSCIVVAVDTAVVVGSLVASSVALVDTAVVVGSLVASSVALVDTAVVVGTQAASSAALVASSVASSAAVSHAAAAAVRGSEWGKPSAVAPTTERRP